MRSSCILKCFKNKSRKLLGLDSSWLLTFILPFENLKSAKPEALNSGNTKLGEIILPSILVISVLTLLKKENIILN